MHTLQIHITGPKFTSSKLHSCFFLCKVAQNYCDLTCTPLLPTWPQIIHNVSHALQQFFMKLAQNNCDFNHIGENPTPTRTILGHTGPDFSMAPCTLYNAMRIQTYFRQRGLWIRKTATPTWAILGHNGPDFFIMACMSSN